MPSITPSTTATPCVKSSTAANATSAHSGSGPIIWPRRFLGVISSAGRPSIDTVKSVPSGRRHAHLALALEHGHRVERTLGRHLDVLDGDAPLAHARLDGRDLAVRLAGLAHRVDVREAVRPLQVRQDDDLVGADHRAMQVRGRRHREAHVGAAAAHLRLVVHDDREAAALDHDVGDHRRVLAVIVVADDRDVVARLDGHADVDDQLRLLDQTAGGNGHLAHLTRSRVNSGRTSFAKRST